MKKGERIVFEATGERRCPKKGDYAMPKADDDSDECSAILASGRWMRHDHVILRRLSPERVAAERRVIEAARAHAEPFATNEYGGLVVAVRDLERIIAAEAPKPRFYADGGAVIERREITESAVGKLRRATFTGPNAEQYAKEHAERLERETKP